MDNINLIDIPEVAMYGIYKNNEEIESGLILLIQGTIANSFKGAGITKTNDSFKKYLSVNAIKYLKERPFQFIHTTNEYVQIYNNTPEINSELVIRSNNAFNEYINKILK